MCFVFGKFQNNSSSKETRRRCPGLPHLALADLGLPCQKNAPELDVMLKFGPFLDETKMKRVKEVKVACHLQVALRACPQYRGAELHLGTAKLEPGDCQARDHIERP